MLPCAVRIIAVPLFTAIVSGVLYLEYFRSSWQVENARHRVKLSYQKENVKLHPIKPKKYAAYSVIIPNDVTGHKYKMEWSYVFHLPITALAWRRIGFYSVIAIIFEERKITHDAKNMAAVVLRKLVELNAKLIYIDVDNSVVNGLRVSQVIRLFPAEMTRFDSVEDYIVTSDADLYPIQKEHFDIPEGKCIHFSRGRCCGPLKFRNVTITHFPMSNIGMSVYMWRKVFSMDFSTKKRTDNFDVPKFPNLIYEGTDKNFYRTANMIPMFDKLKSFFGEEVYRKTWHAGPLWYLDQWYLSTQIHLYGEKNSTCKKNFNFHANVHKCIRVNRGPDWEKALNSGKCFFDSHVLQGSVWQGKLWDRLQLLLTKLFTKHDEKIFLKKYKDEFENTYDHLAKFE